jgi:hypothetical protein
MVSLPETHAGNDRYWAGPNRLIGQHHAPIRAASTNGSQRKND